MTSTYIALAGLIVQLLWIVYWFGFFQGDYREFKTQAKESLARLESVFFKDVKVFRAEPDAAPEAAAAAAHFKRPR